MSYGVDKETCTGCGTCVEVCPAEAIECNDGVANIDDSLCILCGACQAGCPQNAVLCDGEPCSPYDVPPGPCAGELPMDH